MTIHSEAEAVRQAKEYLDIGFVVNAIKRPDGSIAHDQDQLSALYHGFDDLALKLAEKRMPRKATEATPPLDTPTTELVRSKGLKGGRARAAALKAAKRRWSQRVAHRIDPRATAVRRLADRENAAKHAEAVRPGH